MEPGSAVRAVRSHRVLCGEEIIPAVIVIKEGKIHSILPDSEASAHVAGKVSLRMQHMPPAGDYMHNYILMKAKSHSHSE